MRDDAYSRYVRAMKGLHEDWRVYLLEVAGTDDNPQVRLTGAMARPLTVHEQDHGIGWALLKPLIEKRSLTIPIDVYRGLSAEDRTKHEEASQ